MLKSNLAMLLAEKNVTLLQASKDTGINKDTLVRLKKDKAKFISKKNLEILVEYLNCKVSDIYHFEWFQRRTIYEWK